MSRLIAMASAAICACALAACTPGEPGDGADAGPPDGQGFTIRGPVRALDGFEVDPDARLVGYWTVSTGDGGAYVWGSGRIEGDTFVFEMPDARPPGGALNAWRPQLDAALGVGVILALPADAPAPPEGRVAHAAEGVIDTIVGASARFGLIWVEGEAWGGDVEFVSEDWPEDFEQGRPQCGEGVDGQSFERFAPVECSEVELIFGMPLDFVGWT